mgnify:CR=1 FL=1
MAEILRKHGLLKRAQTMLFETTPKFTVWAKRNGFNHCGILSPLKLSDGDFYLMTDSFGFNAQTIANAVVPKSFWDGKIAKSFDWQCFSSAFNETEPYKNLFGEDIRNEISSINFLPFLDKNEPHIFMAIETNDEEDSITLPPAAECIPVLKGTVNLKGFEEKNVEKLDASIEAGLGISSANLFILSLKNSIARAISSVKFDVEHKELQEAVSQSIAEAAHIIIAPLFRKPNASHVGTNGEIKIALFAPEEQDEQILGYHIASNLVELLGEDATKNVLLLTAGICPNKKGTLDFLLHG